MTKVLLTTPSYLGVYSEAKVKVAVPEYPPLTLASLAAMVDDISEVRIVDLLASRDPGKDFKTALGIFSPDIVGISFATPTFGSAKELARLVKSRDRDIFVLGGGPHATVLYDEVLGCGGVSQNNKVGNETTTDMDMVVLGEGDYIFREIVEKYPSVYGIAGTAYRNNGGICKQERNACVVDVDALPLPRWDLVENKEIYKRAYCRKSPIGIVQTSRGCPGGCVYCNKNIFGRRFRPMSVKRSVDEIEHALDSGFKEIHIMDDTFSFNLSRAKEVCSEINRRGLDFPWALPNGIRVDRVDRELLEKMYGSGCYSISFGIESGNQAVLESIKKGITLEQAEEAVRMAKETGLEANACFMLALPGDTEETMQDTINFALKLDPDIARFTVAVPFPGTEFFEELENTGHIHSHSWEDFHFHKTHSGAFSHPDLKWEIIYKYYNMAYKKFYLRPGYMFKRLFSKNIIQDMKSFVDTFLRGG